MPTLSPVTQQHLELFHGGQLSAASLESAKSMFRQMLKRGESHRVEASLCPGTGYAVQIQALAEIGTESAGRILEMQLKRRLSADPVEQAWYWLDLAHGLRRLNRPASLPHLVSCACDAELPLGYFLAAETACFPDFRRYLVAGDPLALEVLRRTIEGLRFGVQPSAFAAGRCGELIVHVWRVHHDGFDPRVVRLFHAAVRWLRRCRNARRLLVESERRAFQLQVRQLQSVADALAEYLAEAPRALLERLPRAANQALSLRALAELRHESDELMGLLQDRKLSWTPEAVAALACSRSKAAGQLILDQIQKRLNTRRWRRILSWHRNTPNQDNELLPSLVQASGNHTAERIASVLVDLVESRDRDVRCAAVEALGRQHSISTEGIAVLEAARFDADPTIAATAEAALAKLGEHRALQRFRQRLAAEEPAAVHSALDWIAKTGLVQLWPELNALAESENADVAFHACEALEQIREQWFSPSGQKSIAA